MSSKKRREQFHARYKNERYPDKPYGWHPNGDHPKTSNANQRRKHAAARHRRRLLAQYDYRCAYCGASPWLRFARGKLLDDVSQLTVDHIVPLRDGGANTLDNLQILCVDCHRKKDRMHKTNDKPSE